MQKNLKYVVKIVLREVSGYLGSVSTISDRIASYEDFYFFKSSSEFSPPIKSTVLLKIGPQIISKSKVVKFGFAPYLGGFVRVYMGVGLL